MATNHCSLLLLSVKLDLKNVTQCEGKALSHSSVWHTYRRSRILVDGECGRACPLEAATLMYVVVCRGAYVRGHTDVSLNFLRLNESVCPEGGGGYIYSFPIRMMSNFSYVYFNNLCLLTLLLTSLSFVLIRSVWRDWHRC